MTSSAHSIRALLVAVIAPLVVTLIALVVMLGWVGSVPNPVAVHWAANGRPDGSGSPLSLPILLVVVNLGLVAIIGGVTVFSAHHVALTVRTKLIAVLALGVPVFTSVLLAWSLGSQRGLASWRDAPSSTPGLLLGLGVAVVLAAAGWFVLPRASATPGYQGATSRPAVALRPGEQASWHHTASTPRVFVWLWLVVSVVVVGAVVSGIVSSGGRLWWLSVLPILLMALVLATLTWTIRVDAGGILVRSALGIPRIRIPLSKVESASVVQVSPLRDFGGWGIRFGLSHDLGIVLRTGEALRVKRRGGRALVVTVDDADSAAALLNGLVEREAATAGD